ncbi:MAG: helix-turn-helix transcriptional regulator [Oscillospiraceae bacterium]|nr:helix-turn-helix transcriptional regulator [Oscillospiraceae bacterium]
MKLIPFQELYNREFFVSEPFAEAQNWFERGNFYSCLGKPKPSHTFLWFKSCTGIVTDSFGTALHVEKNHIAYMPKGSEYTVEFFDTAPNQVDSIVLHFQLRDVYQTEISPAAAPQICIKRVEAPLALSLQNAAEEFAKNIVCVPVITAAIYQTLALACIRQRKSVARHQYKYISQGITLMEDNADMPIGEIARVCGVSEGYFRKLFRKYSGESPVSFRQRHRIEKAKQLLLLDMYSVGEIAEALHFSDIYHFSNTFKKFTGCSPLQYIKQNRLREE